MLHNLLIENVLFEDELDFDEEDDELEDELDDELDVDGVGKLMPTFDGKFPW